MENTAERFTTQNIQDDKVMSDILKVVCEEYEGSGIAYDDKVALAGRLYDHVFVECGSLNEVFCIVMEFEQEQHDMGNTIDYSKEYYIFSAVINMLNVDNANAQRLYESFLEYNDIGVFDLLMGIDEKFLSAEQRRRVLDIAKDTFEKPLWENYI